MPKRLELGSRERAQPAPPFAVYERLTQWRRDPARQWLVLLDDEQEPKVLERREFDLVVWGSIWTRHPSAQVRFDLSGDSGGTSLRWTLLDLVDPGPATVGHLRKRLNQLINAELRFSFGQ